MELGLSADSSYGAGIPDFAGVPFLSNSDAHSPQPEKIGREFNRIRFDGSLSVRGVLDCIRAGAIEANAGFSRKKGRATGPHVSVVLPSIPSNKHSSTNWRCPADGGLIKKGVYRPCPGTFTRPSRVTPAVSPPCPARADHPDCWKGSRHRVRKNAAQSTMRSSQSLEMRSTCSSRSPGQRFGQSTRRLQKPSMLAGKSCDPPPAEVEVQIWNTLQATFLFPLGDNLF